MDIFSIFLYMKVCCVFLLESPHRGDSNKYTQFTIFNAVKPAYVVTSIKGSPALSSNLF